MNLHRLFNLFSLPIILFAIVILLGAFALQLPVCSNGDAIPYIDALFTSASATCVAGLIVLDTSGDSSRTGQCVILLLIQLGGLGIVTYACLIFYLWRRGIFAKDKPSSLRLSWHSSITVKMTWILILFGWVGLFITERLQGPDPLGLSDSVLTASFQSVTCRTAGFNTVDFVLL